MISRFLGAGQALAVTVTAVFVLAPGQVSAAGPGPNYSYVGVNYEWTDVKYGIKPSTDFRFNDGTLEGYNVDFSLGLFSWERKLGAHLIGQYFDGDCAGCGSEPSGIGATFDQDFKGYRAGLGGHLGFDLIGLNDRTDLVLRGYYVDVEQENLNINTPPGGEPLEGDGLEFYIGVRSQISPRTEFEVGYSIQSLETKNCGNTNCDSENRDLAIGVNYRIWGGLGLVARGIIFDDDTGFELGARWYFGDLFGRGDIIQID